MHPSYHSAAICLAAMGALACGANISSKPTVATEQTSDDGQVPMLLDVETDLTPPMSLTQDQVTEDISHLVYILKNAWGGADFVEEATFEKILSQLRNLPKDKTNWGRILPFANPLGRY